MNDLIAIGLTLAGISSLIGSLALWCRPVKFHQLTRFQGNDAARESYLSRAEQGGHLARCKHD